MIGLVTGRKRAAAVIIRDGHLLMIRERGLGPTGRHDGQEYWTLPGGGIQPGETPERAVIREAAEEIAKGTDTEEVTGSIPVPPTQNSSQGANGDYVWASSAPALGSNWNAPA